MVQATVIGQYCLLLIVCPIIGYHGVGGAGDGARAAIVKPAVASNYISKLQSYLSDSVVWLVVHAAPVVRCS